MTDHTSGPWEFSADGVWAVSPWNARVKIATITFFSTWNAIDEKANGKLIAAAPDLYDALKGAELTLEGAVRGRLSTDGEMSAEEVSAIVDANPVIKRIRAALAKAEGAPCVSSDVGAGDA